MTLFPEKRRTAPAKAETSFSDRVVKLARSIPSGRVTTYGAIAKAAGGGTMAARSITGILAKAYEQGATDVPFHRIVYSDGRIWISEQYRSTRMALYKKEGIEVDTDTRIKDFFDKLYEF